MKEDIKQIIEEAKAARESLICTTQRAMSSAKLDQATWAIWRDVRNNAGSLDAERQHKMIRDAIEAYCTELHSQLESARIEIQDVRAANTKLRKELAAARKEAESSKALHKESSRKADEVRRVRDRLRGQLNEAKARIAKLEGATKGLE